MFTHNLKICRYSLIHLLNNVLVILNIKNGVEYCLHMNMILKKNNTKKYYQCQHGEIVNGKPCHYYIN